MKNQKATHNKRRSFVWALTILMSIGLLASIASAETTWYVKASAGAGGDGSEGQPFNSLQTVEQKSEPGDTIIVLACPADIPALDGGIALKDGQKLLGSGPDVTLDDPAAAQAKITNSNVERYSGDGIVLANNNEVTNVHVIDAHRSAISGHNIIGASIHHNLVTGYNQGQEMFVDLDYYGVFFDYYGIHLTADADNAMGDLLVHHNLVRNAYGGGVLLYLYDSASAELILDGNTFTELAAPTGGSNDAIAIVTKDSTIGNVTIRDTFVDNIGSGSLWSDGAVFCLDGSSQQDVLVQGFTYHNTKDVGGDYSFGMIAWIRATADNAKLNFRLEDSELRGMNGWSGVILYVEGANSDITWHVENNVVESSAGHGIRISNVGPGASNDCEIHIEGNQVKDCPSDGFTFANSSSIENVEISLRDNTATDCGFRGFAFVNSSSIENVEISLKDNAFLGNSIGGCYLRTSAYGEEDEHWGGPIGDLRVMMAGNDLVGGDYGVDFHDEAGLTASSIIDLGSGGLGSAGYNRIFDNTNAIQSWNYDIVAKNNWWGSPQGPSSFLLEGSATFDFEPSLTGDPDEEDFSHVFFMPLQSGLNLISLPLKHITQYTARSFAEELSATTVIKLDEMRKRFIGFTKDAPDDGFAIEGGKGYIVNVPEAKVVEFTGAAWTNQPPVEAAPVVRGLNPRTTDGTWAFVVSGRLQDDSTDRLKKDGYMVTIRNTRTNAVTTDVVRSRYFAAAFADLNRQNVVQIGDRLEVVVRNRTGEIVSDTLHYTVTKETIRQSFMPITLKNVEIPLKSLLLQNYPNPFNPETWIPYQLKKSSDVVIRIYNAQGQLVRTIDLGHRKAGFYLGRTRAAYWDGLNLAGEKVASDIYFYQIKAGDFCATRKMLIVK